MLSNALQERLVVADPQTEEALDLIETIFLDNKFTKLIALKGELRLIKLGNLSIDAYFYKIESITNTLASLGAPMSNDNVVTFALHGLTDKYDQQPGIIAHREPFPDLNTVRSMITTKDMRLKSKAQPLSTDSSSSSPTILLTETNNSGQRGNNGRDNRSSKPCFNFAKGFFQQELLLQYGLTVRGGRYWFSVIKQAYAEFVSEGRLVWVELDGVPFKLWSGPTFKRIAAKWGELLDVDDYDESNLHSKRICILSKEDIKVGQTMGLVTWSGALKDIPEMQCEGPKENFGSKFQTPKDKGCLVVTILFAHNRGPHAQVGWRFYSHKCSLWTKVIKAIYGEDRNLNKDVSGGVRTCWTSIVHEVRVLQGRGINVADYIRLKLGIQTISKKSEKGIEEMQLNSLAEISRMTTLVPCEDRYVLDIEIDGLFRGLQFERE
ncbi:hypothetical protein Tco_0555580 [Tanacetum coccineum]